MRPPSVLPAWPSGEPRHGSRQDERSPTNLVHKGVIHEVGATNAQVEHINFLQDGVVECVQKPRRVGDLVTAKPSPQGCREHFKMLCLFLRTKSDSSMRSSMHSSMHEVCLVVV